MNKIISKVMQYTMLTGLVLSSFHSIILYSPTYAEGGLVQISRSDTITNGVIGPYNTISTGMTFTVDSTHSLTYNQITIIGGNGVTTECTDPTYLIDTISKVSIQYNGTILGEDTTPYLSGSNCIYEISFAPITLPAEPQVFDVMIQTIGTGFIAPGQQIQLSIGSDSFPGLTTDESIPIESSSIIGGPINSAIFTSTNPEVTTIIPFNPQATQIEYNNGLFTGYAVDITTNPAGTMNLQSFRLQQIGDSRIGSGGYEIPHQIIILDEYGVTISTGTISATDPLIVTGLHLALSGGTTHTLSVVIQYSGSIIGNDFRFVGGDWVFYDTNMSSQSILLDVPGNRIDILENQAVANITQSTPSTKRIDNPSSGLIIGTMSIASTSPGLIEQLSFVNLVDNFYATIVNDETLGCINNTDCPLISTGGDGVEISLWHEGIIIGSGLLTSGITTIALSSPLAVSDDDPHQITLSIDVPGAITNSSQTNKIVRLGLLETNTFIEVNGTLNTTIITNTIDESILPPGFNVIIYQKHIIRKAWINASATQIITGVNNNLSTIAQQTGATIFEFQLTSQGGDVSLYQLTFGQLTEGVEVSNHTLHINSVPMGDNVRCNTQGYLITCIMSGSLNTGLILSPGNHIIELIADVTGNMQTGNYLNISLNNGTPLDYHQYPISILPNNTTIVWSDQADTQLAQESVNRFTDAGVLPESIERTFIVGEDSGSNPTAISLSGVTFTSHPLDHNYYTITWNALSGDHRVILERRENIEGSSFQQFSIFSGESGSGFTYISTSGSWLFRLTPVNIFNNPIGPATLVPIDHIVPPAPIITLYGSGIMIVEGGTMFNDPGAEFSDIEEGTGLVTSVSGTVNTFITGTYLISYNYTDNSISPYNTASTITREVTVIDTTAPVITLTGASIITIITGSNYIEQGAYWTDAIDGSGSALISGSIGEDTGIYTLEYYYVDSSGNTGSILRTVIVGDEVAPLVTLSGESTMRIQQGMTFVDPGAYWTDAIDGTGTIINASSGSVNTAIPGIYLLEYSHTDRAGNISNIMTRTITIFAPVVISGNTWFESVADTIQSPIEDTIDGMNVYLYQCTNDDIATNTLLASTQTDYYGGYAFTGLDPTLSYQVRFGGIPGFIYASGFNHTSPCLSGNTNVNTALRSKVTVMVDAWFDTNQDGVNSGENTVDGMNVYIVQCEGTGSSQVIASGSTDYYGSSILSFNPDGNGYRIVAGGIPGYHVLTTGDQSCTIINDATQSWSTEFRLVPAQGTITGDTWFDINQDNIQQPGEHTVDGMNVYLYQCTNDNIATNTLLASTQTDYYGGYAFTGLDSGSYQVRFGGIPGFTNNNSNCISLSYTGSASFNSPLRPFSLNDPEFTAALAWMYENGLTPHNTEYAFQPTSYISNQEAAQMINMYASGVYRLQNSYNICEFDNLETIQEPYRSHVLQLCQKGLTRYNYGSFMGNSYYTKASLITALAKMIDGFKYDGQFISPWYQNYCDYAQNNGIIRGTDCPNFDHPITKYEMSLMLYRGALSNTATTQNYSLEGMVYFDDNMSYEYESTEHTAEGVNVYLYRCDSENPNHAIASTVTDYYGTYAFTGLLNGTYQTKVGEISGFKYLNQGGNCMSIQDRNTEPASLALINNYPSIVSYQTGLQNRSQNDYVPTNRFTIYHSGIGHIDTLQSINIGTIDIIGRTESLLHNMISSIKISNLTTNTSTTISGQTLTNSSFIFWKPRRSLDTPNGSGDIELIDYSNTNEYSSCAGWPGSVDILSVSGAKTPEELGQKVHYIETTTSKGYQCLNNENTGGCVDYQIRIRCLYNNITLPTNLALQTGANDIVIEAVFTNHYPQSDASYDMILSVYQLQYSASSRTGIRVVDNRWENSNPYRTTSEGDPILISFMPGYQLNYQARLSGYSLEGVAWFDQNKDLIQQSGEYTVDEMNVGLYLCKQNESSINPTNFLVQQTSTDYYGGYAFVGLLPGYYQLRAGGIPGYDTIQGESGCILVTESNNMLHRTALHKSATIPTVPSGGGSSSALTPITATTDTTPRSPTITTILPIKPSTKPINTPQAPTTPTSIIYMQLGPRGKTIAINPEMVTKPMFAKDLISISGHNTSGTTIKSLMVGPFSIITPEMLRDIRTLTPVNSAWDSGPRRNQTELDTRLRNESSRDRTITISRNFMATLLRPMSIVFP